VSMNMKAREFLGIKEAPVNILAYLKEKYNQDIEISDERINIVLKQKINTENNVQPLSLTIEMIKDASGSVDSYIFIFKIIK